MTDLEIAEHLNQNGYRTVKNKLFTKASISWIRCRYRIPGPKGGDGYTVKETAEHFAVWSCPGLVGTTGLGFQADTLSFV